MKLDKLIMNQHFKNLSSAESTGSMEGPTPRGPTRGPPKLAGSTTEKVKGKEYKVRRKMISFN